MGVNLPLQKKKLMNSIPHDRQPDHCMLDEFLCRTLSIIRHLEGSFMKFSSPLSSTGSGSCQKGFLRLRKCDLELDHGLIIQDQYVDFCRNECKNIFRVQMNDNKFKFLVIINST